MMIDDDDEIVHGFDFSLGASLCRYGTKKVNVFWFVYHCHMDMVIFKVCFEFSMLPPFHLNLQCQNYVLFSDSKIFSSPCCEMVTLLACDLTRYI